MRSRFDPYSYESNWKTLRWLIAFLGVWIVLSIALAFNDNQTASYLEEQSDMGLTTTPPGRHIPRYGGRVFKGRGDRVRLCGRGGHLYGTLPAGRRYPEGIQQPQRPGQSHVRRSHRVARHHRVPVLHGHSSRQPELANLEVVWTAVFAGLCRYLVFRPDSKYRQTGAVDHGAFQGQRPIRKRQRNRGLETNRQDSAITYIWALAWGAAFIFNPILVQRVFFPPGDTIEERSLRSRRQCGRMPFWA